MNKPILTVFISTLLLVSCKKNTSVTGGSAAGTNTNNTSISSSNATSFYGLLEVGKIQNYQHGTTQSIDYTGTVYFSSVANNYDDPTTAVMVDTVRLNGVPMMYLSSEGTYNDTVGFFSGVSQPISYPYTFKVAGKNGIPSFTYTENGPFPTYTGYDAIPDTISKNTDIIIPLTGLSNADNVTIDFTDGSPSLGSGHEISQQFYAPIPSSIKFTAAAMSQFNVSNTAQITVILLKNDIKNVYGKPMMFSTGYNFTKTFSVK